MLCAKIIVKRRVYVKPEKNSAEFFLAKKNYIVIFLWNSSGIFHHIENATHFQRKKLCFFLSAENPMGFSCVTEWKISSEIFHRCPRRVFVILMALPAIQLPSPWLCRWFLICPYAEHTYMIRTDL